MSCTHVRTYTTAVWSNSLMLVHIVCYTFCSFPVRYAQCWVLAGVAVTLMRALGIAVRPVTCYNIASCFGSTLSRYFTAEGDFVRGITSDIVWLVIDQKVHILLFTSLRVYHVSVEAHMTRDDFPPGYDGYQLLDTIGSPRAGWVVCPVTPKSSLWKDNKQTTAFAISDQHCTYCHFCWHQITLCEVTRCGVCP